MKSKRNYGIQISGLMILIFIPALTSLNVKLQQPEPWIVPEEYKQLKNPVKVDSTSINAGGMLYKKHCSSCHGKSGLGDGIMAGNLETFPGDMSGEYYQSQTDGEHFYKTKSGRGEMPKYENKLSDEDIWHTVNYIRTFNKK